MRIAITGASGNIGTALLRRLVADGGHDLVGIARRTPAPAPPYDDVRWFSADLSEPAAEDQLRQAFSGADAVVHLAWGFQPSHDLGFLERLGVQGTRRVLAAADAAGVAHLVHMSSVGAYSAKSDDIPVDESWPTEGVASSPYSRHKVAAERLLDAYESTHGAGGMTVTRLRPGIVGQGSAGSALLRYGMPALVPASVLGVLPLLPLDRRLCVPMVHADDVADAVVRALQDRAPGAFNLAADPAVTTAMIGEVLGARVVDLPAPAVRLAASLAWHARIQPVDPGWLDLGFAVPLLDCGRARAELGWAPRVDGRAVLVETVRGMRRASSGSSPVLRPRTVIGQIGRLLRHGPTSHRRLP